MIGALIFFIILISAMTTFFYFMYKVFTICRNGRKHWERKFQEGGRNE